MGFGCYVYGFREVILLAGFGTACLAFECDDPGLAVLVCFADGFDTAFSDQLAEVNHFFGIRL